MAHKDIIKYITPEEKKISIVLKEKNIFHNSKKKTTCYNKYIKYNKFDLDGIE